MRNARHLVSRRGRAVVAMALAAAVVGALPAAPVVGLSRTACRVTNLRTGVERASFVTSVGAARDGDTLTVRGTCQAGIELTTSLTIRGIHPSGAGTPTLLGIQDVVTPSNSHSVLEILDGASVRLESLTLTGGGGRSGGGSDRLGGGLFVTGRVTLVSVRIVGNDLGLIDTYGAGIYAFAGDVTVGGRSFIGSNLAQYGGGINVEGDSTLLITDRTTIAENEGNTVGGGIRSVDALVVVSGDAVIRDNEAADSGGGIYASASAIRLRDRLKVTGNDVTAADGRGGGVFLDGSTYAVIRDAVEISGNSAHTGGGIAAAKRIGIYGTATITGNTAGGSIGIGGGIYLFPTASITLGERATVTANSATGTGGGIYADDGAIIYPGICGEQVTLNTPNDCRLP